MSNILGDSANTQIPAILGKHTTNGRGIVASSEQGSTPPNNKATH